MIPGSSSPEAPSPAPAPSSLATRCLVPTPYPLLLRSLRKWLNTSTNLHFKIALAPGGSGDVDADVQGSAFLRVVFHSAADEEWVARFVLCEDHADQSAEGGI